MLSRIVKLYLTTSYLKSTLTIEPKSNYIDCQGGLVKFKGVRNLCLCFHHQLTAL